MPDQNYLSDKQKKNQKTLIDELGLGSLSQEKQDKLMIKMTEVVLKRIFVKAMEKLSEAEQEEYSKLIDQDVEPDQLETFLKEKISNYDEMVQKIIEDFKKEMKEGKN